MYLAAHKVEFQPFNRLYSQLTFFIFYENDINNNNNGVIHGVLSTRYGVTCGKCTCWVLFASCAVRRVRQPRSRKSDAGIRGTRYTAVRHGIISHAIYYVRPSVLPPGRNSDPGWHSRLFCPPTHYGSCLAFLSREDFSSFFPGRLASNPVIL